MALNYESIYKHFMKLGYHKVMLHMALKVLSMNQIPFINVKLFCLYFISVIVNLGSVITFQKRSVVFLKFPSLLFVEFTKVSFR